MSGEMKRWVLWGVRWQLRERARCGGLYVAGDNFDFTQAVERALAQHPRLRSFSCWPPATRCAVFRSWRLPNWSKFAIAAPPRRGLPGVPARYRARSLQ